MVADLDTVTLSSQANPTATLIVPAGQPCTLVNLSLTVTTYLGGTNAINIADASSGNGVAPLGPLNSLPFDGSEDVYGIVPAGQSATIAIYPSGTNWQPSPVQSSQQLIAAGLATAANQQSQLTTGAPLTSGFSIVSSPIPSNTFLTGGGSSSVTIQNITRPGYVFTVYSQNSSSGSTVPFVGVNFQWQDAASGLTIDEETWYINNPFSAPVNLPYFGKGPTKGNQLKITFTNYDPTTNANIFWNFAQSTQHIARDDWRGPPTSNLPVYVEPPDCDPYSLYLGGGNTGTFGQGTQKAYLLPLYAGTVSIYMLASLVGTGGTGVNASVTAVNPNVGNATLYSTQITVAGNSVQFETVLPRCPCEISFIGDQTGGNAQAGFSVMALEYAS